MTPRLLRLGWLALLGRRSNGSRAIRGSGCVSRHGLLRCRCHRRTVSDLEIIDDRLHARFRGSLPPGSVPLRLIVNRPRKRHHSVVRLHRELFGSQTRVLAVLALNVARHLGIIQLFRAAHAQAENHCENKTIKEMKFSFHTRLLAWHKLPPPVVEYSLDASSFSCRCKSDAPS